MVNYKGIVIKEMLDKPPTLKPVTSTVSWSAELHKEGELCQNTAEDTDGNTVEMS